jgi:hypothetical protein
MLDRPAPSETFTLFEWLDQAQTMVRLTRITTITQDVPVDPTNPLWTDTVNPMIESGTSVADYSGS